MPPYGVASYTCLLCPSVHCDLVQAQHPPHCTRPAGPCRPPHRHRPGSGWLGCPQNPARSPQEVLDQYGGPGPWWDACDADLEGQCRWGQAQRPWELTVRLPCAVAVSTPRPPCEVEGITARALSCHQCKGFGGCLRPSTCPWGSNYCVSIATRVPFSVIDMPLVTKSCYSGCPDISTLGLGPHVSIVCCQFSLCNTD